MKAQAASLPFTPVLAALISVINTKLLVVRKFLSSCSAAREHCVQGCRANVCISSAAIMLITLLLHIVSSSFFLQSPSHSLILVLSSLPFPALTALPSFSAQLDEILTYKAATPTCAFCL